MRTVVLLLTALAAIAQASMLRANETAVASQLLGSIQSNIMAAAAKAWGQSTAAGPGGGVEACAWEVNNILSNAGLRKIGSNPDYVPSVVAALQAGRGRQISEAETVPGDLTVACEQQHIGIIMANGGRLAYSNSSSRRCFCWSSDGNFSGYFSCGGSTFWRVDN